MRERQRVAFLNLYFEQNQYTSKRKSIWKSFDSLQDVNWTYISKTKNLPIEFISVFANEFSESDWENILVSNELNEEILRPFAKYFNSNCWKYISKNIKLSEEFIKRFNYSLHLPYIIEYQNISDELKSELNSLLQRRKKISMTSSEFLDLVKNSIDRVVRNEIKKYEDSK